MSSQELLRKLIREISTSDEPVYNQKGKIWLAGREITGGLNIGYHAWIIVRDPRDPKGTLKTYSGKSGVGFELGIASAVFNKMLTGGARDTKADNVLSVIKKLKKFHTDSEEYREAMQDTTWGPLLKMKGWDSDAPGQQDESFVLYPLEGAPVPTLPRKIKGLDRVAQESISVICDKIEKAFDNYAQDVPYDPYPQLSSSNETRNSNSFAYTLAKIVNPSLDLTDLGFNPVKYPGWGLKVPGLAP